ncbi:hypothetical protein BV898_00089 [Hypsibius exemplaris]|uniref:Uncharacterized protein n=1 Tax=Hypsibius exemplaris TaxID=2072580 RepID=A0A1W0XEQ8_HYPEX|nr:hypothetical protein BV898_00089 [Hypsibius exemplaris]
MWSSSESIISSALLFGGYEQRTAAAPADLSIIIMHLPKYGSILHCPYDDHLFRVAGLVCGQRAGVMKSMRRTSYSRTEGGPYVLIFKVQVKYKHTPPAKGAFVV